MIPETAGQAYKRIRIEGAGMSSKFGDIPTKTGKPKKRTLAPRTTRKINEKGEIVATGPDGKEVNLTQDYVQKKDKIKQRYEEGTAPTNKLSDTPQYLDEQEVSDPMPEQVFTETTPGERLRKIEAPVTTDATYVDPTLSSRKEQQREDARQNELKPERTVLDISTKGIKSDYADDFARAFAYHFTGAVKDLGLLGFTGTIAPLGGGTDHPLYKLGSLLEKESEYIFGKGDEKQTNFFSDLSTGAGQLTAQTLSLVVLRGMNLPMKMLPVMTALLTPASKEYEQTLMETGDVEKAYLSFIGNKILNSTDALPILKSLDEINGVTGGTIKQTLTNLGKTWVKGGTREGLQEGGQEFGSMLLDNILTEKPFTEEQYQEVVEKSAALGSILGGTMNVGVNLPNLVQGQTTTAPESEILQDKKETFTASEIDTAIKKLTEKKLPVTTDNIKNEVSNRPVYKNVLNGEDFYVDDQGENISIQSVNDPETTSKVKKEFFEKNYQPVKATEKESQTTEQTPQTIEQIISRYEQNGDEDIVEQLKSIPQEELTPERMKLIQSTADELLPRDIQPQEVEENVPEEMLLSKEQYPIEKNLPTKNEEISGKVVEQPQEIEKSVDEPAITEETTEEVVKKSDTTEEVDDSVDEDVKAFVESVINSTSNKKQKIEISELDETEANIIKEKTGIDVEGYTHTIDNYSIKHILSQHGDEKVEKSRGQYPVTKDELSKIPDIIKNYDKVENAGKNKKGLDVIRYEKKYNGTTYYFEEVRTGRNELMADTMYIKKTSSVKMPKPPDLTSETTTQTNITTTDDDFNTEIPEERRFFKTESYNKSRKNSIDRLSQINFNPADPTVLKDLVVIGGYHFENGVRKLPDFAKKMKAELGDQFDKVKGQIRQIFEDVKKQYAKHFETGFYSPLHRTLNDKLPDKVSAEQVRNVIKNEGINPEELQYSKIEEYLRDKKNIDKADLLDYLEQNQIEVKEVRKGKTSEVEKEFDESAQIIYGKKYTELNDREKESVNYSVGKEPANFQKYDDTRHSAYQLPGGENYKEILLTLPDTAFLNEGLNERLQVIGEEIKKEKARIKPIQDEQWRAFDNRAEFESDMIEKYGDEFRNKWTTEERFNWNKLNDASKSGDVRDNLNKLESELSQTKKQIERNSQPYKTSHFPDEENILAHARINDRVVDGQKVLFVEEVQSDLMQTMRKGGREVPDMPFKGKNWWELTLKKLIRYGAEGGYDQIAFTTGIQQVERYDSILRQKVDKIRYEKKGDNVKVLATKKGNVSFDYIIPLEGTTVINNETVDLEDVVGKRMAQQIKEGENEGSFEGDDLTIGGDGMLDFYDRMMPMFLNKYGKKYGVKVEEVKINLDVDVNKLPSELRNAINSWESFRMDDQELEAVFEQNDKYGINLTEEGGDRPTLEVFKYGEEKPSPQPSITLTPELKQAVLGTGQPLYGKKETRVVSDKKKSEAKKKLGIREDNSFKRGDVIEQGILPVKKIKELSQRYLTSRGDLPEVAFEEKIKLEGREGKTAKDVEYKVQNLRRMYKADYGKKNPATLELINGVLTGDKPYEVLKPRTAKAVRELRNHVDRMTRELISNGVVDGDMAARMTDNMGVYLTRSYRIHDQGKWDRSNIPQEVINKAENFILQRHRAVGKDLSREQLDGVIDEILTKSDFDAFVKSGKLGKRDLSTLKRRKDIPKEIRDLMGEYKDPLVNYSKSVLKMSNMLERTKFLNEVRTDGIGKYLFEEPITNKEGKFVEQIVAEGNKTMMPLDGLYTTKEIKDAFEGQFKQNESGALLRTYMQINGLMKYAKVPLSPVTSARNVVSGMIMVLGQGHINITKAIPAFNTVFVDVMGRGKIRDFVTNIMGREKLNEFYKELTELGVVQESVMRGELLDVLRDAQVYQDNVAAFSDSLLKKGKKVFEYPGKLYGAVDDFFRIYSYLNDLNYYKSAFEEEIKSGEMTLDEIKQRVAKNVRNTYPTYSLVPDVVKKVRRFPLTGAFVSFVSESVRTAYHTLKLAKEELSTPKLRLRGAERLTSFTAAIATTYVLAEYTKQMLGISDEEDEYFKKFLPEWSSNNQIAYLSKGEDGVYEYIDVSFTDPYNYAKKIFQAALSGDDMGSGMVEAFTEALEPFAGEELLAQKLIDLARNRTRDDKRIWNPQDDGNGIMESVLKHLWEGLEPGAIRQIENFIKAKNKEVSPGGKEYTTQNELLATFLGQRVTKVDVGQSMKFKGFDYQNAITDINRLYSEKLYKYKEGENTEELEKAREKANKQKKKAFNEFKDLIDSAEKLGVPRRTILTGLANTRLNKDEQESLLNGNFIEIGDKKDVIQVNKILEKEGISDYQLQDTDTYGLEKSIGKINKARFIQLMEERKAEALEMKEKGEIDETYYENKIKVIDEAIQQVQKN